MRHLYQLQATGLMTCFNRKHSFHSKSVFLTPEQATKAIPEFKVKCCSGGLFDLDPKTAEITINELDLQEET